MRFVPRGLLFAKFGSNLTAFFDLAFPICIDAHAPASSNAIAIDQRSCIYSLFKPPCNFQEIDYTKEAANAEQFADNFKNMDYVKVPTIFWEYTTPQVLTMEYVPGIKINRIKALDQLGVDRKRLGRYAVESYLEQILSHGFFHADPHPGNIAVDDVNGGRLIFYDFGMMGSISPNIREGLLEVFYGVHEKDAEKVLQAMVRMGVLVPTGDMTAVRRTAQFFLNRICAVDFYYQWLMRTHDEDKEISFEERLAAQRREREVATAELGFKKPLTKEEKIEKKKQRLAAIGEDLLAIAADQPFRFPATFTFVVRAFSVLDGIGKGLDPRFDITEIAKPYALELLRFREAGVEDFRKRWDRQSQAFYNLFRQADRVEKLAQTIQRLEQGDLKLRVGALESERAFQRVAAVQNTIGSVRKCFHGNREGVRHSQISLKLYRKMRFVPRGLLFAKFGSNLTAFFDLAFPEIDYTKEAANAEQFADNFKNMDYVKVPTIFWEYTTPQVLTMEYVPGIKINRIKALDQLGVDRKRLGRYAVESYLEQILSHGFFHADPHPGNIAVDDVNGGRLIFYDFGMMGSISPNIREGLLEVFYGVHEKDAEKVLQAMVRMGVLVPTGDMTAVRRTAQFFLNRICAVDFYYQWLMRTHDEDKEISFEERLAAQRREREVATAELGFKKPLTKEEKIEKKKQRLAAIGEDLLAIAADQPFRFPATFTFVVRAFSVLDGIGKGLDPRFDITEIAKPKRWDRQSQAFYNLFRQADRVEKLAQTIQRLEQGDLKLRVGALESERAFQRVAAVQNTIGSMPAIIAYCLCAYFGLKVLIGIVKVKKFDQRERLITGTA
ncbi:UNVERIFIED_CONTAM: protein ACTIVITY OF BC1 COMPLEX kinase, chloroplastic [Sesamum calycinum]|uniref:Protein ACTIVITY OF BC1 COMPLEX kinase, chloroplastic n=1 Tax=Sesamum calycinum TaxID=2727403 RepID=A0AAW2KND2_9LAMI